MNQIDLNTELKDRAIFNPTGVFRKPKDILDGSLLKEKGIPLTDAEKIRALETWEYDILIQLNAGEENMHPERAEKDEEFLAEIKKYLMQLRSTFESRPNSPTKFGSL